MDIPARPGVSCLSTLLHVVEELTTITMLRTYNVLGVLARISTLHGAHRVAHGLWLCFNKL